MVVGMEHLEVARMRHAEMVRRAEADRLVRSVSFGRSASGRMVCLANVLRRLGSPRGGAGRRAAVNREAGGPALVCVRSEYC